jgi:cytochrome c556
VLSLNKIRFLGSLLIAACILSLGTSATAQDKLSVFMQRKLGHAEKTLEGLAREDYDAIITHSQAISLLCEDELWAVLQTAEYRERSNEFRRSVNAITDAARKKNLEAAALAYVDATLKCVSCH